MPDFAGMGFEVVAEVTVARNIYMKSYDGEIKNGRFLETAVVKQF